MKKTGLIAILLICVLTFCACGAPLEEGQILRVNDQAVTEGVFNCYVQSNVAYFQNFGLDLEAQGLMDIMKTQVYSSIVDFARVRAVCAANDLTIDTAAVDQAVAEQIAAFPSPEEYQNFLKMCNMTEADVRWISEYGFYSEAYNKFVQDQLKVTDEDAQKAYTADPAQYDLIKTSHILISYPDGTAEPTAEQTAAVTAKAQEVIDKLKAGGDFAALAKEYGTDGTKDLGGVLDMEFSGAQPGNLNQDYVNGAIKLAAVGDYTQTPVITPFGAHIIKLDAKKSGFEVNKEQIIEQMKDKQYTEISEKLIAASSLKLKMNDEFIKANNITVDKKGKIIEPKPEKEDAPQTDGAAKPAESGK